MEIKRLLFLSCIMCVVLGIAVFLSTSFAQQVEISSSLNPVGSGARAAGMGGAFIGVADDATAASWNPAGLVQLEKPEISAVYSWFHRVQGYGSSAHPEIETDNAMDADGLNYASIVYPFSLLGRNAAVSLNYQRLYEMSKQVNATVISGSGNNLMTDHVDFTQSGYLYTISPAFAIQIVPSFYIGATLNIWDNSMGKNGWDNTYELSSSGSLSGFPVEIQTIQKQDIAFEGTNAHFGFLWMINNSFTLGGVYKTGFDADIERKTFFSETQEWPSIAFFPPPTVIESEEHLVMRMPPSYGVGLSYRYSDSWSVAFDIYRTEWSRFVLRDESENEVNPLTGLHISEGRLKDTTQLHLGSEYLIIENKYVIPIRCGLFYDPEPETGSLDDYYGVSLGAGYGTDRIAVDMAYQYRWADNVTGDVPGIEGVSVDIDQHLLLVSAIFYF